VLQEREYEPLGGVKTVNTNVRVVAATNRSLAELVSEGKFRDDLYFRLAVVRLTIPPLYERREDIPLLTEHFIQRFNAKRGKSISGVTPRVMEVLMRYAFPGNVRELENIIEYGFVLCHNRLIDVQHLPEHIQPKGEALVEPNGNRSRLKSAEADAIRAALRHSKGHLGKTARELGISRTTLWRKMKQHGIASRGFRKPGIGS
jgi:DNA-binding NtrC family response regulator